MLSGVTIAFAAVVERFGDLGLKVHVTELDIAPACGAKCYGNATTVAEKEARQAAIYASALSVCLRAAHCEAFVFWEGTDAHPGGIKPPGMAIFDAARAFFDLALRNYTFDESADAHPRAAHALAGLARVRRHQGSKMLQQRDSLSARRAGLRSSRSVLEPGTRDLVPGHLQKP